MNISTEMIEDQYLMLEKVCDFTDGLFDIEEVMEFTGWTRSRSENVMANALHNGLIEHRYEDVYWVVFCAGIKLDNIANPREREEEVFEFIGPVKTITCMEDLLECFA